MVRLTEMMHTSRSIKTKLEGHLDRSALAIVQQTLVCYERAGLTQVHLVLDGKLLIEQNVLADVGCLFQKVNLYTDSDFLRELLRGHGLIAGRAPDGNGHN